MADHLRDATKKMDFISREAAEQVACEACERPGCPTLWGDVCDSIDRLNTIPAADVRPVVRGEWKTSYEAFGLLPFCLKCSKCNEATFIQYNYCPNCGADMRGENQ